MQKLQNFQSGRNGVRQHDNSPIFL
jgi:hypothetical protein